MVARFRVGAFPREAGSTPARSKHCAYTPAFFLANKTATINTNAAPALTVMELPPFYVVSGQFHYSKALHDGQGKQKAASLAAHGLKSLFINLIIQYDIAIANPKSSGLSKSSIIFTHFSM